MCINDVEQKTYKSISRTSSSVKDFGLFLEVS
jgi:hypothetical protein